MLRMIGVTETIARDEEEYISIASRLGRDREYYLKLKQLMKNNQHRLFDDLSCVKTLEDFYRIAVHEIRN